MLLAREEARFAGFRGVAMTADGGMAGY